MVVKYVFLSLGTRLKECKLAAEHLNKKEVSTTIIDARFAKPLDEELIIKCAREHEILVSIEEGSIGGFGSHVKNLLAEKGIFDKGLKFRSMNLPDKFIEQDTPNKMYEIAGLNASQISKKILDILFNKKFYQSCKKLNCSTDTELYSLDSDHSSSLSIKEIQPVLKNLGGMNKSELEKFVNLANRNGTKQEFTYTKFVDELWKSAKKIRKRFNRKRDI